MKKVKTVLAGLAGALTSIVSANYAIAAPGPSFPMEVFDANYKYTNPGLGDATLRMVSDGKGHMRNEIRTDDNKNKSVAILDYPAQSMVTLVEAQHIAMKMPLKSDSTKVTDEASAKKANAKSLGVKIMDGHSCHGYETKDGDIVTQSWIGVDTHYMVHSEINTPNGKIVMALKSWSKGVPKADLFQVPSDYKLMDMPQIGMNAIKTQR